MYLSILRYICGSSSKQGYFDSNKSSEYFFKDMLNIIDDRELVNLNFEHKNHPAIDLGDKKIGSVFK